MKLSNKYLLNPPKKLRLRHIKKFKEFLAQYSLATHEGALELGQALKVSWKDLVKLADSDGYIGLAAQENILFYLQSGKLSPKILTFLQAQKGNCGEFNHT